MSDYETPLEVIKEGYKILFGHEGDEVEGEDCFEFELIDEAYRKMTYKHLSFYLYELENK